MKRNERGSAAVEAAGVSLLLFAFVSGLLLVTYLLFARVWIQYQSEQSLYCLAEGKPSFFCKRKLLAHLQDFLPWGHVSKVDLSGGPEPWKMRMQWNFQNYTVRVHKQLANRTIIAAKVSP